MLGVGEHRIRVAECVEALDRRLDTAGQVKALLEFTSVGIEHLDNVSLASQHGQVLS